MIDEKKLIEDMLNNDGIDFRMDFNTDTEDSVLESLREFADRFRQGMIELVQKQPKVGEWIPVSVNKPQRQDSKNTIIEFYFVSTKRGNVRLGFRDEDGEWLTEHGNIISNVIAWMPLPPAYKE